jgi:hypothetical protein
MSLYGYVGNDPVNFIDPTGYWSIKVSLFAGLGGTVFFGHDDGKWFATADFGAGLGAGASFNPNGSFPNPVNGNKYDGVEGFVGVQGWAGASIGPASVGGSYQVGMLVGTDCEGDLHADYVEAGGTYDTFSRTPGFGINLGIGVTMGVGIAW